MNLNEMIFCYKSVFSPLLKHECLSKSGMLVVIHSRRSWETSQWRQIKCSTTSCLSRSFFPGTLNVWLHTKASSHTLKVYQSVPLFFDVLCRPPSSPSLIFRNLSVVLVFLFTFTPFCTSLRHQIIAVATIKQQKIKAKKKFISIHLVN